MKFDGKFGVSKLASVGAKFCMMHDAEWKADIVSVSKNFYQNILHRRRYKKMKIIYLNANNHNIT